MMAPMPHPRRATVALALALALAAMGAACGDSSRSGTPATTTDQVATTTNTTTGPSTPAPSRFGAAVLRGTIVDDRVTESSGVVASRRHPGRLWTHNDSDNPPVVFCVEPDGGSCGGWTVDGAGNLDWEDIAAGPGPQPGEHYLYVGDIGDNTRSRDDVVVYRVVEPTVPMDPDHGGTTAPATAIRFRYDDGPHDAESLMVHPTTGDVYVVVKQFGDTGVYRGPPQGGVLTRIATAGLGPFARGHRGRHLPRRAAGGAVQPRGRFRADARAWRQ